MSLTSLQSKREPIVFVLIFSDSKANKDGWDDDNQFFYKLTKPSVFSDVHSRCPNWKEGYYCLAYSRLKALNYFVTAIN